MFSTIEIGAARPLSGGRGRSCRSQLLLAEVLDRQGERVRRLLLCKSILEQAGPAHPYLQDAGRPVAWQLDTVDAIAAIPRIANGRRRNMTPFR